MPQCEAGLSPFGLTLSDTFRRRYWSTLKPAMPPDVRRGFAPPVAPMKKAWAMPMVRALPVLTKPFCDTPKPPKNRGVLSP